MPAPFLFVDIRGGATPCTLYRYQGATPAQVGNTYGTRYSTSSNNSQLRHGARQYKGNLYALASDGVYVKDDPTVNAGTWTLDLAFTNPEAAEPRTSGLHIVSINDEPILVVVFGEPGNSSWSWAKYDGTSWTQAASPTTSATFTSIHDVIVYRNVIHIIGDSANVPNAMSFDPASETFAVISDPFAGNKLNIGLCVFNNRLFAVYMDTGAAIRLAEFAAGSWSDVPSAVGHSAQANNHLSSKMALFTDGTYLYGMVPATDDGWKCLQWDNTLGTPTDISTTVLPSSLLGSTDGGTYSTAIESGRFIPCLDQDTDPAIADIWLFQSANFTSGTPWALWKWNGNASLVTQVDSGGDVFHAIPSSLIPGGEHIWTAGEMDIWITGKIPIVGGERIKFRASGAAGVADKTVGFRHNNENEPPLGVATLTAVGVVSGAPAGAPSLGTNEVLNVDADPTVEYYADWDLTTDGFTSGDRAQLKPSISV